MSKIVHMVGDIVGARLSTGEVPKVQTRCGRLIVRPVVSANVGPTRYDLIASNGNEFFCTTRPETVTCQKCRNIVGTAHVRPSRPPVPQKRAVAHAHAAPARAARAHARARQ